MPVLAPPIRTQLLAAQAFKSRTTEPDGVTQLLPQQPLPSVAEISNRLYTAYDVQGGNLRLAGCALELRPIVHVKAQCRSGEEKAPVELFLGDDGLPVEQAIVADLKRCEFAAGKKPQRFSATALNRLIERANWLLAENCRENGGELIEASAHVEIFWRLYAEGKLRFTIGDRSITLAFTDWADRLQPPAIVCPETGTKTHRIAATDDGRIAATEEIVACQQTGRQLLRSETIVCSITGQRIAAELADQCPITGDFVHREQMQVCPICQAKVSPQAIDGDRCRACAAETSVKKSDPRMCLALGEHPGLERWRRWQLAETPQAYVLQARSLLQRLLVVVDKQSLEVRRLARRGRFQSAWLDIPSESWKDWLQ